jgi:microcystin-dependent protein
MNGTATEPLYNSGTSLVPLDPTSVSVSGGSAPHGNMQPYMALAYYIAALGIYPSRP